MAECPYCGKPTLADVLDAAGKWVLGYCQVCQKKTTLHRPVSGYDYIYTHADSTGTGFNTFTVAADEAPSWSGGVPVDYEKLLKEMAAWERDAFIKGRWD